jgi:hypothetical protein
VGFSAACGSKYDLVIGRVYNPGGSSVGAGGDSGAAGAGGYAGSAGFAGGNAGAENGGQSPLNCAPEVTIPEGSLVHRYDFAGTGTSLQDTVGTAHGELFGGAVLDGSGTLIMDGEDDYVNLPNGIISVLEDATFSVWTSWRGGAGYQRVFDFGVSSDGEDQRGHGATYIAVSPFTGLADGRELAILAQGQATGETKLVTLQKLVQNELHQVVVVFVKGTRLELYYDGALLGTTPMTLTLAEVNDVNNWLGQSQWENDHVYNGSYSEFRIYNRALDACMIKRSFEAGPDVLP